MTKILTQSFVQAIVFDRRKLIADGGCKGLYVDVWDKGVAYRFRYTNAQGKQRSYTIGDAKLIKLTEARSKVYELSRRLALGDDIEAKPAPEPQPLMTFRQFVEDRYLPQARLHRRSLASETSALNIHVLPAIGDEALIKITKGQITALIHNMSSKGLAAATVNRVLAHIKAIFNRAIEWEIDGIEKNPAKGIKPIPNPKRHERFLTPEEAKRLLEAVSTNSNKMLPYIIAFLLLTGCRKREVLDAKWDNIDLECGLMVIPLSKNGKPRHIPLSPVARNVLLQARLAISHMMGDRAQDCQWVFPNPATGKPFVKIQKSWENVRKQAGLDGLRIHDLRHSFASALVNKGMTIYDVKEALGHSSIVTTQRYSHLAPQRLMDAVCAVQDHYDLSTISAGKQLTALTPPRD